MTSWETSPIPGGWEFKHTSGARILIDYIYPTSRGLEAWVELRVDDDEIPVAQGQRNLMVAQAIRPFVSDAEHYQEGTARKVPWEEGLRQAFYETIEAWREGSATVDLTTVEPKGLEFLVDPIIESGGATRLIAAGGFGKSLFASALALTVVTGSPRFLGLDAQKEGPVLYLDWETNQDTHAQRIHALCSAAKVPVPPKGMLMYRNESVPLYRSVQAVRRAVDRTGAVMLVIDSAKMAAGPSGQSSGEEATLSLHAALREIGPPAAIIDHKAKEAIEKKRRGGYGNVFNDNLARMVWEFTNTTEPKRGLKQFVLELTKENNVGQLPPLAFQLSTSGGKQGIVSAKFTQVDPQAVYAGSDSQSWPDRVFALLVPSPEPLTADRILEMLGPDAKRSTIAGILSRDGRFTNVENRKGYPGLYRLTDELLSQPRDDGFQEEIPPHEEDDDDDDEGGAGAPAIRPSDPGPPELEDGLLEPISDWRDDSVDVF